MDSFVPKKVGKPRLNKTTRLLHRFYEPLVLLRILEPTRGGHRTLCKSDHLTKLRRECLDHLSWTCDYEPGGETVAAIAIEATPDGIKYWLSTNERSIDKSRSHLEWILHELSSVHLLSSGEIAELKSKITSQCITFSKKKLKNYSRRLSTFVKRTEKLLSASDIQLRQDFSSLNDHWQDDEELCDIAYKFRNTGTMDLLETKHANATRPTPWSLLRHYLGRMGSWPRASKALVELAKMSPRLFNDFRIGCITSPQPIEAPEPDAKTNLYSALGRMVSSHETKQLEYIRESLLGSRVDDFAKRFFQEYTDPKFQPRVHAELMLIEQFYQHNAGFIENDNYVGCSKPSCYCCDLYMKHHPGNLVPRPCHGNVWKSWRAPVPPNLTEHEATNFTAKVLNSMANSIRRDVMFQIASKNPPRTRLPDSSTGRSFHSFSGPLPSSTSENGQQDQERDEQHD